MSQVAWDLIARPFARAHRSHVDPAGLWDRAVLFGEADLDAPPGLVALLRATDADAARAVRTAGLLHHARASRETIDGRLLLQIERTLGAHDWQQLRAGEASFEGLAVAPQLSLTSLLHADGTPDHAAIDARGATLIAGASAAIGAAWRLLLAIRLPASLTSAVSSGVPCPRPLAIARLEWLSAR